MKVFLFDILRQLYCQNVKNNRKFMPNSFPIDKKMNRGDITTKSTNGIHVTNCKYVDGQSRSFFEHEFHFTT